MNLRATGLLGRLIDALLGPHLQPGAAADSPAATGTYAPGPAAARRASDAGIAAAVASAPIALVNFRVERDDLLCPCTRAEIEQRELAVDPMGGAPAVPFGHLNPAWCRFVATLRPDDALWSFHSHRVAIDGAVQVRTGYVVVRNGMALQSMIASHRATPAGSANDRTSPRRGYHAAVNTADEPAAVE